MVIIANQHYQPRFEAFILHRRLAVGDEVKKYEFMSWIRQKWTEFERQTGAKSPYSDEVHESFTQWLINTAPSNAIQLEMAV